MILPRTPSFRLDGRRALVTGGSRGLGLAAAVALAEAGAAVTILARSADAVAEATQALTEAGLKPAPGVPLDVTDHAAARAFIERSEPFDVLVNSAGMGRHSTFLGIDEAAYEATMELNLGALLFLSQAVAKKLIAAGRPGSIINVSSQMGHVSAPERSLYSASKFAVEGLTKGMAIELAPHGIRVNTLCPTFIETEMTAARLSNPEFRAWVVGKIKLGRLGIVEDIMGPVVFLASDASSMMTGSALLVDGGWTAE